MLTVGEGGDPLLALQRGFDDVVPRKIGTPEVVLGCDCVLRRMEFEQAGQRQRGWRPDVTEPRGRLQHLLASEYNAIYVNQTLSAVALSAR